MATDEMDDIFEKEQIDDFNFISSDAMVEGEGSEYSDDAASSGVHCRDPFSILMRLQEDFTPKKRKQQLIEQFSSEAAEGNGKGKRKGRNDSDSEETSHSAPRKRSVPPKKLLAEEDDFDLEPQEVTVAERLEKGMETLSAPIEEKTSLFSAKLISRTPEPLRKPVTVEASPYASSASSAEPGAEQPRYRSYARVPKEPRPPREDVRQSRLPGSSTSTASSSSFSSSSSFASPPAVSYSPSTGPHYPGVDSPRGMYFTPNTALAQTPNQYGTMGVFASASDFRSPTPPPLAGSGLIPGLVPPPRSSSSLSSSSASSAAVTSSAATAGSSSSSSSSAASSSSSSRHHSSSSRHRGKEGETLQSNAKDLPSQLLVAEQKRRQFKQHCVKAVLHRLQKFLIEGKIATKDDFKHLARKLAHKIMEKEQRTGTMEVTTHSTRKIYKYVEKFFKDRKKPYKRTRTKREEPDLPRELLQPPP